MQKLTNQHVSAAYSYLAAEPEMNVFFLGDLEQFGMEGEQVSCGTSDRWKPGEEFPWLLLRYRDNALLYSRNEDYDASEAAKYIKEIRPRTISGKDSLMRRLLACLPDRHAQQTQLARLETVTDQQKAEMGPLLERVRLLTPGDIPALYDLYMKIEEFAYNYRGKTREACYEDIRMNVSVLGRTYGIFEGERLACAAQTSAESPLSAMIVGVATDPDFRGRGYAKASVLKLCADCLEEGRQFVCLFFDNPDAWRIYRSIGFTDVGAYTMLRSGE